MRKEKENTIDGRRLKVTQLGFEEGMDLLVLLTKTLGPSLGALATDSTQIAPALSEFAKQLNNQDLKSVIATLAKSTRINREGDKWPILEPEVDLAGEYGFMFKTIPAHIRWEIHRVVTSEQYKASLIEVQRDWSIDDVMDANEVLDLFEKLSRRLNR